MKKLHANEKFEVGETGNVLEGESIMLDKYFQIRMPLTFNEFLAGFYSKSGVLYEV